MVEKLWKSCDCSRRWAYQRPWRLQKLGFMPVYQLGWIKIWKHWFAKAAVASSHSFRWRGIGTYMAPTWPSYVIGRGQEWIKVVLYYYKGMWQLLRAKKRVKQVHRGHVIIEMREVSSRFHSCIVQWLYCVSMCLWDRFLYLHSHTRRFDAVNGILSWWTTVPGHLNPALLMHFDGRVYGWEMYLFPMVCSRQVAFYASHMYRKRIWNTSCDRRSTYS